MLLVTAYMINARTLFTLLKLLKKPFIFKLRAAKCMIIISVLNDTQISRNEKRTEKIILPISIELRCK